MKGVAINYGLQESFVCINLLRAALTAAAPGKTQPTAPVCLGHQT